MYTTDQIIEVYGRRLGELARHSLNLNKGMTAASGQHAGCIREAVPRCSIGARGRPIRILENGAYSC